MLQQSSERFGESSKPAGQLQQISAFKDQIQQPATIEPSLAVYNEPAKPETLLADLQAQSQPVLNELYQAPTLGAEIEFE